MNFHPIRDELPFKVIHQISRSHRPKNCRFGAIWVRVFPGDNSSLNWRMVMQLHWPSRAWCRFPIVCQGRLSIFKVTGAKKPDDLGIFEQWLFFKSTVAFTPGACQFVGIHRHCFKQRTGNEVHAGVGHFVRGIGHLKMTTPVWNCHVKMAFVKSVTLGSHEHCGKNHCCFSAAIA